MSQMLRLCEVSGRMLCVIRIEVFRFDRDISICHEIFRCWQIIVAISKAHEHLAESQALLDDVQELHRKFLVLGASPRVVG